MLQHLLGVFYRFKASRMAGRMLFCDRLAAFSLCVPLFLLEGQTPWVTRVRFSFTKEHPSFIERCRTLPLVFHLFGKAGEVFYLNHPAVVQYGFPGETAEYLVLVGFDELDIGAGGPVQYGPEVHLKAPVV